MEVKIENISKSYGPTMALDDVSVEIDEGSFFSLLGPTGHGKTTLLRIIAGVEDPDEGQIYFDDEDITNIPPQEHDVSIIFQDFALYRNMNVFDNIAFPLRVKGNLSDDEIEEKVRKHARRVNIESLLDRDTTQLSGGEEQRTALARALAKEADLILMDEPLTNLDYKLREQMRHELQGLEMGTVIHATSEPLTAMSICTHTGIIKDGKIHQFGESQEVYDNPKNTTVGRIYSHPPMNFLNAELVKKNGDSFLKASEEIKLKASHLTDNLKGDEFMLGIRPGNISIEEEKESRGISFSPLIQEIETKGSDSIVHLDYEGNYLKVDLRGIYDHKIGDTIELFVSPRDVFIFDRDTEKLVLRYRDE